MREPGQERRKDSVEYDELDATNVGEAEASEQGRSTRVKLIRGEALGGRGLHSHVTHQVLCPADGHCSQCGPPSGRSVERREDLAHMWIGDRPDKSCQKVCGAVGGYLTRFSSSM